MGFRSNDGDTTRPGRPQRLFMLPDALADALAAYCAGTGEEPAAIVHDAIALWIDENSATPATGADEDTAGGCAAITPARGEEHHPESHPPMLGGAPLLDLGAPLPHPMGP